MATTRPRTPHRPDRGRGRHRRLSGGVALVLALLLPLSACGSDEPDAADSADAPQDQESQVVMWADDVCSTASAWMGTIDEARATMQDRADLSADKVRDAVDSISTATDEAVADLTNLTPPDTAAGDQAQAELSALAGKLEQQKDTISQATDEPSTTMRTLLATVSTVTGTLATMLTDITTTVENLRQLDGADELTGAFQDSETCQQLAASASPSP